MMRNIIRFVIAILAIVAAGLFIYFNNSTSTEETKSDHKTDKAEKQRPNEFKVNLPTVDLDSSDPDKAPQLDKMKQQASSMHATINHIATEGAFDGEALNTGKIKSDIQKVNMQLEETKSGCSSCKEDIIQYMTDLQGLSQQALTNDTQALGKLYTNLSEFDKQLNGLEALSDARDLSDLFNKDKAEERFTAIDDWVKEAKARLDLDSGDLQMLDPEQLKQKAAEAEQKMKAAAKASDKATKLMNQAKQQGLNEAYRKELQKKATKAKADAEALRKEAETAQADWKQMQNDAANTENARKSFAEQAKAQAEEQLKKTKDPDTKKKLDQISKLSDDYLASKQAQQQKLDALQKAFEDIHQTIESSK